MNIYGWLFILAFISVLWAIWSYRREIGKGEHEHARKHLAKERVIFQSSSAD